jgi:hypothetical protein
MISKKTLNQMGLDSINGYYEKILQDDDVSLIANLSIPQKVDFINWLSDRKRKIKTTEDGVYNTLRANG